MRPDAKDLYRVTERFPDGQELRYVAFRPVFDFGGITWWMNRRNMGQRSEEGLFHDRGDSGFAILPARPESPLCVFEPLTLKTAKNAGLMGMGALLDLWDEDEDVLEFFRDYFSPLLDLPASDLRGADSRLDVAFAEARGIPAKVGERHKWRDGNTYEKQSDGSWRRVNPSDEFALTSHPEIPKNTAEKYFNKETQQWSPERRKIHKEIFEDIRPRLWGNAQPVPEGESPMFTFVIGPPSSGKSTRKGHSYDNAVKLDPDLILERLPEFQRAAALGVRTGAASVKDEALKLNNELVAEAEAGRFNYVMEGTGGNLPWIENTLLPRLKKQGYKVNVVVAYVDDLDELLLRSESRGQRTGRFVPPDVIEFLQAQLPRTFKALLKNKDIDGLALMDTGRRNGQQSQVVAYERSSTGEQVHDARFLDLVVSLGEPKEKAA